MMTKPYILLVAGPSGAGKRSVTSPVVERDERLRFSISCTTRTPRQGEIDGMHYHFLSREAFEAARAAGEFVEWAEVFGNLYGTRAKDLRAIMDDGLIPATEIDVQGVRQLVQLFPDEVVSVFLFPPSWEELERRLRGRRTEDEATVARRLRDARAEVQAAVDFDYWILNDRVEDAQRHLRAIVEAECWRRPRWHKHPLR